MDEREGHTVCIECGTIHDERCCKEDHDFERHSIVVQDDLDLGDRKAKKQSGIQELVRSVAMHNTLPEAVMNTACDIAGFVNIATIQHQSLSAWALICVAGEIVRSGFQMGTMAKAAEVPVNKLLGAMDVIRAQVKHLLSETTCADTNDPLIAVAKALELVFAQNERDEKIAARKYILKLIDRVVGNAPFMNITPDTRAKVLVAQYLKSNGLLTKDHKKALGYATSSVRNGFKRLHLTKHLS